MAGCVGGHRSAGVVLFDWDGTLVDTRAALLTAWHELTEEVLGRRFPVTAADQAWAFSRRGAESFPQLSDDPEVVAALLAGFSPAYLRHAGQVRAFPGVADALRRLRGAGLRTAVVTSKTRDRFDADAERTGLRGGWDVVVCAEDVTRGKPHPEPVDVALRRLGAERGEAVMVGDGPADMQAAVAAGVRAVGVSWGFSAASDLIASGAVRVLGAPAELPDVALEMHP